MLNIIVPIAGRGSRFAAAGYTFPKPLIEINGQPMIELVTKNIAPATEHRFIFVALKEHYQKYALQDFLQVIAPNSEIIQVEGVTAGAACTVLLAKEHIDNDDDLMIANSDQYIDFDINKFVEFGRRAGLDGAILTFEATHPKWSYARKDENGFVTEVAEKRPISNEATVVIYHFRHGKEFVQYAENMIRKDVRVNNEFYVAPVYNELILAGKKIQTMKMPNGAMHGLGTPEDLELFIKQKQTCP